MGNNTPVFGSGATTGIINEVVGTPPSNQLLPVQGILAFTDTNFGDKHTVSATFKKAGSTRS